MKYYKTLSVYAFTLFVNAAISFAGFSILTHYLNGEDLGIINLYTSCSVLLTPFIAIGTPFLLGVEYFKLDDKAFKTYFVNAITLPAIACVLFTIVFAVSFLFIEQWLNITPFFIVTLPLAGFMMVLSEVMLNLFRNKRKGKLFAGYSIGRNVLDVGLSLVLIIGLSYGWQGRLGGSLISLIAGSLVLSVLIKKWSLIKGALNPGVIGAIALSGLPFIPERLAIFVLGYSDRFFIDYFRDTASVGYYGAGAQVSVIINMAIIALNNTFYPELHRKLSEEAIDYGSVRKITFTFLALSVGMTLAVLFSIPFLFRYFIGPDFQQGQQFARYLSIGSLFWAIYNVFIVFLLNLRKNRIIMYISLLGMFSSLLINFLSVPRFGALGATYTNVIVYFLMTVLTVFFVSRYYSLGRLVRGK